MLPTMFAVHVQVRGRFHLRDGRVEIHAEGRTLPYSIFDQNPNVTQGQRREERAVALQNRTSLLGVDIVGCNSLKREGAGTTIHTY